MAAGGSAPAQVVHELLVRAGLLEQLVAGLTCERLEVAHRPGIGGDDLEDIAARHVGKRLLGLQDRQRTVQPAGVDFLLRLHRSLYSVSTSVARLPGGSSIQRGSMPRERSQSA